MKTMTDAISAAHSNLIFDKKYYEKLVERSPISEEDTIKVNNENNDKWEIILDSIKDEQKVKQPFLEYMEGEMSNRGQQFVLTGKPSAGKTTELNRIARRLIENISDLSPIIHLFSLQNASNSQASLESAEDLWQWIIRGHQSRIWAEQRYSLAEFIAENNRLNLRPILLIDTVDMLIYGAEASERKKITEYWQTIISTFAKEKEWTVLWSCREYEWNEFKKSGVIDLTRIQLPELDYKQVAKRFKDDSGSTKNSENAFLSVLGVVFPIVAGHKKNLIEWHPIILKKYKAMHDYARDIALSADDIRNKAGPITWIIKNLKNRNEHELIGIDPLYEGLVDIICDDIAKKTNNEKSRLVELWHEEIESEFFAAAYASHTTNSRIYITHDSINVGDSEDGKLLDYLVNAAKNADLLKTNPRSKTYEMAHQLFAEYCVWKVAVRNGKEKDEKIDNFPSCKIRGLKIVAEVGAENEELIKEARRWFLPFYVFNENLALKYYDRDIEDFSQTWQDCIHEAAQVLNIESRDVRSVADDLSDIRFLNDEKRELLRNIDDITPLLVNGPPGVGKSHLSYVWIDKKASGDTWSELQTGIKRRMNYDANKRKQKPKAHFMTLSRGLVKQIDSKIDEYYDTSTRPAEFTSWSIPDYINKMRAMLKIETSDELTFDIFKRELEDATHSGKGGWKKVSPEELWGEFQNNYIDKFGKRKKTETYQTGAFKSKFFDFAKDPSKEAKLFAQWAKNVGGNKKSLSEQAGECIKTVLDIIFDGSLEDREAIRSMQSEILVLDEIQDLPSPVIFLLLLMHIGPSGSVMMCGDDEQTLELSEFKWEETFSKIAAAFYEYDIHYNDYSSYEANCDILKKWINKNLLNEMVKESMQHLVVVERSVPPIVECVSESWNSGVSIKIPGMKRYFGKERGTGCIRPGKISEYRQGNNRTEGTIDGVEIHNNWTWELLIEEAQKVYDDGEDVAFLFPDPDLHEKFSVMLANVDIEMDLWTPRLIKGLEYPTVIAICPWEISREWIGKILGDATFSDWKEVETYAVTNENTETSNAKRKIDCITKLAKQKQRHVNVMLSRSQNLLKIVNIPDETEYFKSESPALSIFAGVTVIEKPEPKKEKASITEHLDKLPEGWAKSEAKKEQDDLIASRKTTQALINRLRNIILSADTAEDRKQIQLKANHLAHYLEKINILAKTENIEFPFLLLSKTLKFIDKHKYEKYVGLFDSGWSLYKEITEEFDSPILVEFESYVKKFASKCWKTDDDNELSVPVLELQKFNDNINRHIKNFTCIDSNCFVDDLSHEKNKKLTLEGQQLREEVQNEIVQSIFGKKRRTVLDVNQWIETAKNIDLEDYLTEIDCTAANNEIFRLVRDLIEIEEEEIESHYEEINGEKTWKKLSQAERKKIITDKRAKVKDINMELVSDYWARGNQYLLKQKISQDYIFAITNNIGNQLHKIEFQSYNFSKELVDLFWTCIKQYCSKDYWRDDQIQKMIVYCYHLHNLIQEEDKDRYNLNSVLSDNSKASLASKLLDAERLDERKISRVSVISNNSLGLFDLLIDNYPISRSAYGGYQDYKNALRLGNELAEDPVLAIGPTNTHEIFAFLSDKIMDIFENEHTMTDTFANSCEKGKLINWDEPVIEQIFTGVFGKYILSKSTDKSRENILVLLFALIHKVFQGTESSDELISQHIKQIFTISESLAKGHKWQTILLDDRICEKIILIPYPSEIQSHGLHGSQSHWIWEREVGQYNTQIKWNNNLIKILEEQKIDNKLEIWRDGIIESTSSLLESSDEKKVRTEVKNEIISNICKKEWRAMVRKKGRQILNKEENKKLMPTIIPGIPIYDVIMLYDEIDAIIPSIVKTHVMLQGMVDDLVDAYGGHDFPWLQRRKANKKLKEHIGMPRNEWIDFNEECINYMEHFSIGDLLIDFAMFFNRINDDGVNVIENRISWKKLLETYKDYLLDQDSRLISFVDCNIIKEIPRGKLLSGSRGIRESTSINFQKILITFLQNFGSDSVTGPGNFGDKEAVDKYRVLKNSNYKPVTAKRHIQLLENLP